MNGESTSKQLDRLEEYILRLEKKIDKVGDKVDLINVNGCAHRSSDLERIMKLEGWRDKGIVGIITLAIAVVIEFFSLHR